MKSPLPTLRFGPVLLDFPVVQAALSGYSDWAMRVVARRLGAPYTLCEVLLDKLILQGGRKTQRFMKVTDRGASGRRATHGERSGRVRPGSRRAVAGRLRRDRYQLWLPGEEGAGPLPRRVLAEPARDGAGDRLARARGRAAADSGHGEDAPRPGRYTATAATISTRFSTALSPVAWRRSPCMAAPCSNATSVPAAGSS